MNLTLGWCGTNFYPRPPRGGRPCPVPSSLSMTMISIHALREEGDQSSARRHHKQTDFYPRPPRGGRPAVGQVLAAQWAISIHALREEGD